ncbi:acyltransferase family protein [Evansella clarkii]|uniref:acyltransferase family protein n=1 Tax=Evansella clarkii TaxID=79879 RepID=UPI0023EA6C7F|nr:acyltransferase family protein [Evansella clarkii]
MYYENRKKELPSISKKIIYEAYWLRAIACMAVVITHAVNTTLINNDSSDSQFQEYLLIMLRFMAFFGTPAFVFISELLISRAYPTKIPQGFLIKRVKYLLFPYVFMGAVFAVIESNSQREFFQKTFFNLLLGGYTGYFILIIFQFYILHILFSRFLKTLPVKPVIFISFIINLLYLALFNFTEPFPGALGEYLWARGYWMPFIGWIFYFILGYYSGLHFDLLKEKIKQYRALIFTVPPLALLLLILLVRADIVTVVSSKRLDMPIYTAGVIMVILYLTSKYRKTPEFILVISKYSFNIYLLHKIFLFYLPPIEGTSPFIYFVISFLSSLMFSVLLAKLLSFFKFSHYLIGKPLPDPRSIQEDKFSTKLNGTN